MKIAKVELRELNGTLKTEKPFWEERLVRPIDIYPEYRSDTLADWDEKEVFCILPRREVHFLYQQYLLK